MKAQGDVGYYYYYQYYYYHQTAQQAPTQHYGPRLGPYIKLTFLAIHLHLLPQYELVELELKLFIRKVNAKLLEAVVFKYLKSKDVKDTNVLRRTRNRALADSHVDAIDQPVKELPIERLRQCVPHGGGCGRAQFCSEELRATIILGLAMSDSAR